MTIDLFGASVAGPAHLRVGRTNQDAWGHGKVGAHRVVVVADGLGSKPQSGFGARAATVAVPRAVRCWLRNPAASTEVLLGLVHMLWRAEIAPVDPGDAATTCLFAVIDPAGAGLVAQLGDGLILLEERGAIATLRERADSDFCDRTEALGVTRRLAAWSTRRLSAGNRRLVLCTDGVADDLLPEKLADFVAWLDTDLGPLPPDRRWRALAQELRNWPTPRHTDDKTIAFMRSET